MAEDEAAKKDEPNKPVSVDIDFSRLSQRIQALPLSDGYYTNLQIATSGQLHYLKRPNGAAFSTEEPGTLARFDLVKRKEDVLLEGVEGYELSRDAKRVLLQMRSGWSIADAGEKLDPSKRKLAIDKVEVRVDSRAEWKQIYDEAYRLHRDWFYDPNHHGANLAQVRESYAQFLPHLTTRQDLTRLLQWSGAELSVGHLYIAGFPQANRQAIVIDERYNGGGLAADYYIDILRWPLLSFWATRYGGDMKTPHASIQGPKVMIVNETAGSGGDYLPWMFRKLELGPIVGRRTWEGLVGILGFPPLMDGGMLTSPNFAFWDENGFGIENIGVPPDIEVDITPADYAAGRDPQLEKALEVVLRELEAKPVVVPKRPAYPNRVQ